jgi:hypothetical protein
MAFELTRAPERRSIAPMPAGFGLHPFSFDFNATG